jgi:hypothetical protein
MFRRKILPPSSELKCVGSEIYFIKCTRYKVYVRGTLEFGVNKRKCSSETSVSEHETTRCQKPGDYRLNTHHSQNIRIILPRFVIRMA